MRLEARFAYYDWRAITHSPSSNHPLLSKWTSSGRSTQSFQGVCTGPVMQAAQRVPALFLVEGVLPVLLSPPLGPGRGFFCKGISQSKLSRFILPFVCYLKPPLHQKCPSGVAAHTKSQTLQLPWLP